VSLRWRAERNSVILSARCPGELSTD
jgi:hypothetical protein